MLQVAMGILSIFQIDNTHKTENENVTLFLMPCIFSTPQLPEASSVHKA